MKRVIKGWRDGRGGTWQSRIEWFQDETSIRLKVTYRNDMAFSNGPGWTRDFKRPEGEPDAQLVWDEFKRDHKITP